MSQRNDGHIQDLIMVIRQRDEARGKVKELEQTIDELYRKLPCFLDAEETLENEYFDWNKPYAPKELCFIDGNYAVTAKKPISIEVGLNFTGNLLNTMKMERMYFITPIFGVIKYTSALFSAIGKS